ncbi:hypothetical protein [Amycolatopsis sp. NPDC049159]
MATADVEADAQATPEETLQKFAASGNAFNAAVMDRPRNGLMTNWRAK